MHWSAIIPCVSLLISRAVSAPVDVANTTPKTVQPTLPSAETLASFAQPPPIDDVQLPPKSMVGVATPDFQTPHAIPPPPPINEIPSLNTVMPQQGFNFNMFFPPTENQRNSIFLPPQDQYPGQFLPQSNPFIPNQPFMHPELPSMSEVPQDFGNWLPGTGRFQTVHPDARTLQL